jgi:cation diffusion facilitator CzcD-associated flavoprotein CzcO
MVNTVIVGAGPYGLSLAAYLRHSGVPFRIFGRPMDSWKAHMPKGMCLKSDGFASNIYDPKGQLTLEKFCGERGIPYSDTGIPVQLETFCEYGLAFQQRMVPELEDKLIVAIERIPQGYKLRIDDGEVITARSVVLAVGITHFEYVPDALAHLPAEFLSHSARYNDPKVFKGRSVVVVGAGASALDWAGLLHEAGVNVQLVARRSALKFHGKPTGQPRSLWQRIQKPQTGLGPGWRSSFYSNAPGVFYRLPQDLRLEIVKRTLGPSGGWFIRDKVVGKMPLSLGSTIESAEVQGKQVVLQLRAEDGMKKQIAADHIMAATGYKVQIDSLKFLSAEIRSRMAALEQTPVLSAEFESSLPGLYFVGVAASNSFGPVMRFAYGAEFAARTVSRALAKSLLHEQVSEPAAQMTAAD